MTISLLSLLSIVSSGQITDKLVSNCIVNAGSSVKYLKDFRIQLGKGSVKDDFRFKTNITLWKNTRYRFTMCNADGSKGELLLNIKDESKRVILSSYDSKTKKIYPYIDFVCYKTGIYELNYDFKDRQPGSGVGLVSMVK
jgi:hypothetical protein